MKASNSVAEYAEALHALASILKYYQSAYKQGLFFLFTEVQVRLTHDLPHLDRAYLKTAILNMYLGKDKEVLENANLALKTSDTSSIRATALNVIGDTLFIEDPDRARNCFHEAEQLFEAEADTYNLAHVRLSNARLLGHQNAIDVALKICHQELEKVDALSNPGIHGTANLRLAEIHTFNGAPEKAQIFAKKALAIGIENNWVVLQQEASQLISD